MSKKLAHELEALLNYKSEAPAEPVGGTPRTDQAVIDWMATDESCVYADFARQLERDLNTSVEWLKNAIERAEKAEREIAGLRADAERWRYGCEHGWPKHWHQSHPEQKILGWRMPSQEPPDGKSFSPADYPYYETADAAIDSALKEPKND